MEQTNEQTIKEIGKDSLWYFTSTLIYAVLGFIALPILSRLFTQRQYGILSLCTVTVGFSIALTYWLVHAVIRYYSVNETEGTLDVFFTTVLRFVFYFSMIMIFIVAPVTVLSLPDNHLRVLVALVILVSTGTSISLILMTIFRAKRLARYYSVCYLSEVFGRFILGLALVGFFSMGPEGLFIGWLAALVIIIPIELHILQIRKHYKRHSYSSGLMREFFRFGVPLSGTYVMVLVLSISDRYLVQAFRGSAEVGLYAVIYTMIAAVFDVIFAALPLSAEPVIIGIYEKEGEESVRNVVRLLTRYALMVMIPVGAGFFVLQSRVMHVVVGPQFYSAKNAILPLVLGLTFERLVWFTGWGFILKKKTSRLMWIISISALTNIVLNLFMIPAWGYMGAAISTAISYLLSLVIMYIAGRKYLKWDVPWISLFRIALTTACMSVGLYLMDKVLFGGVLGLLLIVIIGTLVYGGLLLALRELHWSELRTIYRYGLRKMGSIVPWIDLD